MKDVSWWRTDFGTEEAQRIELAIANENISQGVVTEEFECCIAQLLDVPYVVATTSGSVALLMSLMAMGVGSGDEVIVPNRTWIATAHAPLILGAMTVLVDVEEERPIIDVEKIEAKITARTKAIMPAHLNGRASDMETICRIAQKNGLRVIEDAAQALRSRNDSGWLGTQGDVGCFSLSVAKIIATGQGGFVVTGDEEVYRNLKAVRSHGVSDVINASWSQLGFNFRFTDILASIGLVQLGKLESRIKTVRAIYERYYQAMSELPFLRFIPVDIEAGEIPIYIEALCSERDELMSFLASRGIGTRPFYPDLDLAPYLENSGDFPNSRVFGEQGLFLPSGPAQPLENIDRVIDALLEYGRESGVTS